MRSKRFLFYLAVILLIGGILAFTHVGRYIFWNVADVKDLYRFPAVMIKSGPEKFHFEKGITEAKPGIPSLPVKNEFTSFDDFLEKNNTFAFLAIKDDSIIYERYFQGYDTNSLLPGFSIAKSAVSALVGVAVEDGAIKNVHQPVTDYLHGWKHEGFDKITIENLLNMRSGILFRESYYNPFAEIALFYYGKNLRKYTFRSRIEEPPGINYNYVSVNAQILAYIIEEATGTFLPEYFEQKIWQPIGAEHDGTWNLDSEKHGSVKAFCCLNATARDFAKFGRLYLNYGKWNDRQVIPESFVRRSASIINGSLDSQGYPYTYMWRVLETGQIFAKGVLGQYIYIDFDRRLIMLRFGTGTSGIDWIKVFNNFPEQS